ncbi:MAG: glycoside hydrolase family 127 protein [Chloroflexi bacterium]|nr:glycoside hydrolase family 127 protein [Chloroflexota bacterium]
MDELLPTQVTLQDPFWSPRAAVNATHAIFHQWEQLEASGCIANFRIAAGEAAGLREGWFFADSDAYKWLDAASRITVAQPTPRLAALMDDCIALLGRSQMADGYLFTYNQIHFPGTRWTNLQIEHELYCHGHLIEAGVSHFEATGRTDLLAVARRAADLLVADFAGAGPERTPGHEEIELALLRLYRATGYAPYLDLARHFLEQRGRTARFGLALLRQTRSSGRRRKFVEEQRTAYLAAHPQYNPSKLPPGNFAKRPRGAHLRWLASALTGKYFQQHAPIRQQTAPVGHSVRFGYLQTAVAMLHRASGDASLLPALAQAWERLVTRRMYVTGGLGAQPALEGFSRDYELDPEYAYAETCAALACIFWNWQMALITGEARYSDLLEWQLYNAAAVGIGLGGDTYLYNNPLACRGGVTRQAWYAVPCCPSNLSRTWADLGKYVYSVDGDDVYIHQWIGNRARLPLGVPVDVEIASGLPWSGEAAVRLAPERPAEFGLHLRVPSWSAGRASIRVNGQPVLLPAPPQPRDQTASGFDPRTAHWVTLRRRWAAGDLIELDFDLTVTARHAHPRVRGHTDKVALTRGPLVYCLESSDNPGLDLFTARIALESLRPEIAPDLLGGIVVLRGQTRAGQPVTAIPYALWGNRGASQMTVWVNS